MNSTGNYGGGMYLLSSILKIMANANVLFINHRALVQGGAIYLSQSTIYLAIGANLTFFNNRASDEGGAIYLRQSTIDVANEANLDFINNTAGDKGGALYVDPGVMLHDSSAYFPCFLQNFAHYAAHGTLSFTNNSATNGGDDVYGGSLQACNVKNYVYGISSVSSDPLRVCMCESPANDKPQCSSHPHESYNYANLIHSKCFSWRELYGPNISCWSGLRHNYWCCLFEHFPISNLQ